MAVVLEDCVLSKQAADAGFSKLSNEMALLRKDLITLEASLRQDSTTLEASLRQEIKISASDVKSEIIKWVFGISFAQAALIISVIKFIHIHSAPTRGEPALVQVKGGESRFSPLNNPPEQQEPLA